MEGSTTPQPQDTSPSSESPTEPPPPPELKDSAPDSFELPEWLDFLRNRLILGGLGIVVTMLLLAIVLVALGGEGGGVRPQLVLGSDMPEGTPPAFRGDGLAGRMLVTVSLRNGPGVNHPILGIVPSGALVSVIGRDADEGWLQIVPAAGIPGWVPRSAVDVAGEVSELVIGAPGEGPSVVVPTQIPVFVPEEPVEAPTLPSAVEPTPTLAPPPTATPQPVEPTATLAPAPTATPPGGSGNVLP